MAQNYHLGFDPPFVTFLTFPCLDSFHPCTTDFMLAQWFGLTLIITTADERQFAVWCLGQVANALELLGGWSA